MTQSVELTDHPDFTIQVAESRDATFLNEVVSSGIPMWKVGQSITLIAVYRMKQLFESYDTRRGASDGTGYTSWTDWLTSHDWPMSMGTIRTRVLDIENYRRNGASWEVVQGILASAPTAGHDVFELVANRNGDLLPHIRHEDLPGGSVQGLLEALATSPTPGQGRATVTEVSGAPRLYAERMIHTSSAVYLNIIYQQPETTTTLYFRLIASDGDGDRRDIPPPVAEWLADKLNTQLETLER